MSRVTGSTLFRGGLMHNNAYVKSRKMVRNPTFIYSRLKGKETHKH